MQDIDLLLHGRWVIPVEPDEQVLEHHCVAVNDGRILALLPSSEAAQHYRAETELRLEHHALIPGLVNAHTHTPMNLLRGLADDLPMMEWLHEHIWPAEQRWVNEEFVHDGGLLAMAEMLRGGITCFNDMYFFPEVTARAAAHLGMRACVGLIAIDFPTVYAGDADEYLAKGLALHDSFRNDPLIRTAFAPHAPYSVSDAPLTRIQTLADELDIPVHMHVHESAEEVEQAQRQGERPLARLDRLGLLSPALVAVHMTQLTDDEIARLAETGSHVVHCPESNLKLASGFCPTARLEAAGVNLALGTDGAASNNDLDLFSEMRTAALLGKAVSKDATALPAHRVLRMATLNGARALGLGAETGSLEPGKWADITAVDLATLESQPVYHPVSQLVYAAGRHQVSDVWVAGRHLLKERALTGLDADELLETAAAWQGHLAET
ncbi:TRZ/ATZ family hydrolase [Thiohalobacter thiocyanaticus]|uniref:5-methylthioadenosine/S-adenosylhomocysteine deaminase n=1 Tax=Thiohalobacter thiocyanaticus TaxID=585455 RepID=A0A426QMG1_9GAMM|nr:TRZ/ATZ family hydrolase [Thiohalobacter thiocyanaticus]RRQ22943.1 TRZ/ATZ family hydrolase [Thiohalobacter thiocyanaticus]